MLHKFSAQQLATIFLLMLSVVTIGYYILPGYASFFALASIIIGAGPFAIIFIIVVICLTISIVKIVTKSCLNEK